MLTGPCTVDEFAALTGAPRPLVASLLTRGVLSPNGTARDWLHAYGRHLRELAAGRAGDLAAASAALKDAQRQEVELRLAIKRREVVPLALITQVLAKTSRQCAGILEGLIPGIRLRWPDVTSDQLKLIEAEVALVRNRMAAISLDDLLDSQAQGAAC